MSEYVKQGMGRLDQEKLPDLLELKYYSVGDAAAQLDGVAKSAMLLSVFSVISMRAEIIL